MTYPIKSAIEFLVKNGKHDLTSRQLAVLFACESDAPTVRDLSTALGVTKPAITRAADKLESTGFVKRKPHKEDRRMVLLCITKAGREFARQFS